MILCYEDDDDDNVERDDDDDDDGQDDDDVYFLTSLIRQLPSLVQETHKQFPPQQVV